MIDGLLLVREFISQQEENTLINDISKHSWSGCGQGDNPEMTRMTQMYGYLFSYRYRTISKHLGSLPYFVDDIKERIYSTLANHLSDKTVDNDDSLFDMLLVNEYLPGQGIMPHNDATSIFGPTIAIISLLSDCVMRFTPCDKDDIRSPIDLHLPSRSLLIISGDARYHWKHEISKNFVDVIEYPFSPSSSIGASDTASKATITRGKRISLTFRSVLPSARPSQ